MSSPGTRLLLLGATGLVGRAVLALALADARVTSLVAPGRRSPCTHPKLVAPTVDFDALPTASWWRADTAICALGGSLTSSASREAFRRVDYGYVSAAARRMREAGTPAFTLLSSLGANAASPFFYTRVKGELERHLATLGFVTLTVVRPSMINGAHDPPRRMERAAARIFSALNPVLPRNWRMVDVPTVARALLENALLPGMGSRVVGVREMMP